MNVVLCGMMGCGKTAVSKAYSAVYGVASVDTDAVIVERYGEINSIFASQGEQAFRNIETQITKEVASTYDNAVISLGGGCVLRSENVRALKQTGKIFYLRTGAETIIKRLRGDNTRPLLQGNLEERVNTILANRSSVYEAVADCIIDTDGLTPEEIAKKIRTIIL
ncbi:MAG: shikimate kinase [Candidatus Coproplasma sp.]